MSASGSTEIQRHLEQQANAVQQWQPQEEGIKSIVAVLREISNDERQREVAQARAPLSPRP